LAAQQNGIIFFIMHLVIDKYLTLGLNWGD